MTPDQNHRVHGTTYPRDRAPDGAAPLHDRIVSLPGILLTAITRMAVSRLRLGSGDVLVIRGTVPTSVKVGIVRALHKGNPNDPVAVFLPQDCSVHIERSKLEVEDRGHRDTKNIERDKTPERGVFTGVQDARDPR